MKNFTELINSTRPVLVDFYANWCGPCKTMVPILKEVKSRLGDEAILIKVDVDKNQQAANAYQVKSIPALLVFKNGKILWRGSGVVSANELVSILKQYQ